MSSVAPNVETVERIVELIRRDLMLGSDAALTTDTKLYGGDFDLDSLDALLLMQSLEKHFGFSVPSETFGPEVFATVGSLAQFVDVHRRDSDPGHGG